MKCSEKQPLSALFSLVWFLKEHVEEGRKSQGQERAFGWPPKEWHVAPRGEVGRRQRALPGQRPGMQLSRPNGWALK